MEVSRRQFIAGAGAVAAGAAAWYFIPRLTDSDGGAVVGLFPGVKVASLSDLQDGVPVFFDYPLEGQSNILVKMGEPVAGGVGPNEDIVAYSRLCTHMGCPLTEYNHDYKALGPCACHFTTFDLIHGGMVTMGQATQNLPQIVLNMDGDDVIAGGVVRLVYGYDNTLEGAALVGGAT